MSALGDGARGPVGRALHAVLENVRAQELGGALADYIPELAKADPDGFGIAVASVFGRSYASGDASHRFTIQSVSKPFVYALALAEHGSGEVLRHVGVEPSGEAFNAISFDDQGRPANPMINAGAIVTASLIGAAGADERLERIRVGLSRFAGRELGIDETVYRSESATGDRNRALATLAKSTGVLATDVHDAVEPYFGQCSLLVDAEDVAVMGATLANHGINPMTGERVVADAVARDVLSLMTSCGMYDHSGQWMFEVGMPAKSGVGGGIVAVTPGQYGVGVFSPLLDRVGNSSRGVAVLRTLSQEFGLHMFDHPKEPASPVQEIRTGGSSVLVIVRGVVDFDAVEEIIHRSRIAADAVGATTLTLDFTAVTAVAPVAVSVITGLADDVRSNGTDVRIIDPSALIGRRLEHSSITDPMP